MKQSFRVANVFLFSVLLTGCTYNYDEPRPPEEVTASPEAKLTVKNINATPDGFEVTRPFPAEGPCAYSSSSLAVDEQDYSGLVAEYVKNPSVREVDLKNGALRPNLHYQEDAGVTVIVPDDLFGQILNGPTVSNGMIRVVKQAAESLVRDNLSDFEAFLRMVGTDDATPFYVARTSCLDAKETPAPSEQALCPFKPIGHEGLVYVTSQKCVPHVFIADRALRLDGYPESGPCSTAQAKQTSSVVIDFTRYAIGEQADGSRFELLIDGGMIVVLDADTFNQLKASAEEIPDDDRLIYPISQESFVSLRAALPSLDSLIKTQVETMSVDIMSVLGRSFYVASDSCRAMMARQ